MVIIVFSQGASHGALFGHKAIKGGSSHKANYPSELLMTICLDR